MKFVAIILARGGSKGIPHKNIININGKPLLNYSIEQCINAGIKEIYTSSDDEKILQVAKDAGSNIILRPNNISGDLATSESGWIHAVEKIPNLDKKNDWIFAPQVTSPIRETFDVKNALELATTKNFDSIFSAVKLEDFFLWQKHQNKFRPINYDFKKRLRRQDIKEFTYLENGSFFLFKPYGLIKNNNRLHGRIGITEMEKSKMFQIDNKEDIKIVESMLNYLNIS